MSDWTDTTLAQLSLPQKVGQTICYRAGRWHDETLEMARLGLVGCVAPGYYAGMNTLDAQIGFMNELDAASPLPVSFIGSSAHAHPDFGATPFPDPGSYMVFGAARDSDLAYRFARAAARESRAMGYDMVWEPCVDVNTEPRNPIIGPRAFSDRPELVAELSVAIVRGMQQERIVPNAKHYPGHGDTAFDTHVTVGRVEHALERLRSVELYPYAELIQKTGLRGIMTAHITVPALDPDASIPATFSRRAIHDFLRHTLCFEGLIVSDSLTMKAIKDNYGVADAAVRAFNAGHDLILQDYDEPPGPTFEALLEAVRKGVIPEDRLDASVRRVLEAKEWSGVHQKTPVELTHVRQVFSHPDHLALATAIFEASVTLLEDRDLPLSPRGKACLIATRSAEEGATLTDMDQTAENSRDVFFEGMAERLRSVTTHVLPEHPTAAEVAAAHGMTGGYETVVLAIMPRIVCHKPQSGTVGEGLRDLVRLIRAQGKRVVLCVFGTPYVIPGFSGLTTCLTTYSSCPGAVRAGIRVLFGDIPARGKLPVTLSERYPYGFGL